mgnify:CR=1 FL=1
MPDLIRDIKESVEIALSGNVPKQSGWFKVYGEIKGVPKTIVSKIIAEGIEGNYEIDNLKGVKKGEN